MKQFYLICPIYMLCYICYIRLRFAPANTDGPTHQGVTQCHVWWAWFLPVLLYMVYRIFECQRIWIRSLHWRGTRLRCVDVALCRFYHFLRLWLRGTVWRGSGHSCYFIVVLWGIDFSADLWKLQTCLSYSCTVHQPAPPISYCVSEIVSSR